MTDAIRFRDASIGDVPEIVALLADDVLGATRDDGTLASDAARAPYEAAFAAIDRDPNQVFIVADRAGTVVGCMQLSFLPGLAHRGALRAQVESVRIAAELRGQGVGARMLAHAEALAVARGATLMQLTTDRRRADAHRFYERLGFVGSHLGMKKSLRSSTG